MDSTAEKRRERRLILAIDFDGTIVDHEFPKIGKLKTGAKEAINSLHNLGHKIIIWTCRNHTEKDLNQDSTIRGVQNFLEREGVKYDVVNENHPDLDFHLESRKVYADIYIDDRNLGGFPGWGKTFKMILEYDKRREW